MKSMKSNSILVKFGAMAASLALLVTSTNINSVCIGIIHQPKLPEGAKDLRKF